MCCIEHFLFHEFPKHLNLVASDKLNLHNEEIILSVMHIVHLTTIQEKVNRVSTFQVILFKAHKMQ